MEQALATAQVAQMRGMALLPAEVHKEKVVLVLSLLVFRKVAFLEGLLDVLSPTSCHELSCQSYLPLLI